MASEVAICNLSLSHLGDSATVASISPPEGSAQAEHCERWYPMARDTLLQMHDWGFATKRATLAALATVPSDWGYAYALPPDFIKLIGPPGSGMSWASLPPDGRFTTRYEQDPTRRPLAQSLDAYAIEAAADGSGVLYARQALASIRYVARIADTTRFSPLFTDALTWLLASYLAGPVLKGETGAAAGRSAYTVFLRQFGLATASDANQQRSVGPMAGYVAPWAGGR